MALVAVVQGRAAKASIGPDHGCAQNTGYCFFVARLPTGNRCILRHKALAVAKSVCGTIQTTLVQPRVFSGTGNSLCAANSCLGRFQFRSMLAAILSASSKLRRGGCQSRPGAASRSFLVYSCFGALKTCSAGPNSTMTPFSITVM